MRYALELLDREEERGEGEDGKEATAKILSKEEKKTILSDDRGPATMTMR